MIFKFLIPICCCFTFLGVAQDTLQLTNTFEFNNGVYLTINDLQANRPNYTWQEVKASAHFNREKQIIRLENLNIVDSFENIVDTLSDDDFWGICVNGVPYIRVEDTMRKVVQYVLLRTRGSICYFYYDSYEKVNVPMTIYDPNTRKPVWVQDVINKEQVSVKKMLDFSTGEVADLDLMEFKNWVKKDPQLTNTISDLSEKEASDKLYKMLLIYNDRNPYYLK